MQHARGQRQQRTIAVGTRGEQFNVFVGKLLPWRTLRGNSKPCAGVIKAEDLAIGMAFLAHHLRAYLAETNAVSRSPAVKDDAVAVIADVVQVALQAVPANVASDGGTKHQSRDADAVAAHDANKLHSSA